MKKSLITGILSFVAVLIGIYFKIPTWAMFLGWVSFGVWEGNIKRSLPNNIMGALLAYIAVLIGGAFGTGLIAGIMHFISTKSNKINLLTLFLGGIAIFAYVGNPLVPITALVIGNIIGLIESKIPL